MHTLYYVRGILYKTATRVSIMIVTQLYIVHALHFPYTYITLCFLFYRSKEQDKNKNFIFFKMIS